jgi:hypothetical protein
MLFYKFKYIPTQLKFHSTRATNTLVEWNQMISTGRDESVTLSNKETDMNGNEMIVTQQVTRNTINGISVLSYKRYVELLSK